MKFQNEDGGVDENAWSEKYDCWFFSLWGMEGGQSRSPKKLAAVRQNLINANAARKAKAEARRRQKASQGPAPPEDPSEFPSKD